MQNTRKDTYESVIQTKYRTLKDILPLNNGWEFHNEKNDVRVYMKKDNQKNLNIVRGEGRIDLPASKIAEHIVNIEEYPLWDKTLEASKCVEKVEDYVISYARVRKAPGITTRESVSVSRLFYEDDGTIIGVGASVDHPDYPIIKQAIRVEICLIGWVMIPEQGNKDKTRLIYIFQIDPKGWVPKTLYNIFCFAQAQNINKIKRYMLKSEEKSINKDQNKGELGQTNPEKENRADNQNSVSEKAVSNEKTNKINVKEEVKKENLKEQDLNQNRSSNIEGGKFSREKEIDDVPMQNEQIYSIEGPSQP